MRASLGVFVGTQGKKVQLSFPPRLSRAQGSIARRHVALAVLHAAAGFAGAGALGAQAGIHAATLPNERTAALIEERRETLMALGLVGIVGVAVGIGIAVIGL